MIDRFGQDLRRLQLLFPLTLTSLAKS